MKPIPEAKKNSTQTAVARMKMVCIDLERRCSGVQEVQVFTSLFEQLAKAQNLVLSAATAEHSGRGRKKSGK